ncbi:MAG: hypothetical protein COT34_01945 [Candidatus Nealsonbacteria bacterium CG08_land_8_20_14_0_20_43_11]|uniref:AB hydrolase-1 domain-containing protein n=1 Tax=Candidatus Nealsonbacteria bacterium CG08_land_8_20_14_0_20_43_11 TaxID=1974706 RepID=A0A2M6T0T0_9BACT|nr:MAG: hypothetical protein COT34_01945 [Candidatus Nealsonbacteria bacterium CG08_land_8_20_14_0_20_43_11]
MDGVPKTIVILHGWGSSSHSWLRAKALLEAKGYNALTPDLPGFGRMKPPLRSWRIDDYVEWVKDFLTDLELDRVFLLGHSFGGRIAIKLAAKYPELFAGLILVSAGGIKHKKTPWQAFLFYLAKIGGFLYIFSFFPFFRRLFYRFIVRRRDYFEADGVMRETFKKVIEEDLAPLLKEISVPTAIIWGEKDKMTPVSDGQLMNTEIKSSVLTIIPENGHALNLDASEKLVAAIIEFLRRQGAG